MPKLSYADLLAKCKVLQNENDSLKTEVSELKQKLQKLSEVEVDKKGSFYYKDSKKLDMNQVLYFGNENFDYVNTNRSLEHILKTIYCNDDHLENRVLHHMYLNEAWLVFKFKDHVLRYFIDTDTIYLIDKMIIGNIERRLNVKFEDTEMRLNAINALIMQLGVEVREKKFGQTLPIWEETQFKKYEQEDLNRHKTNYLSDMGFGSNINLDTKKWDKY
tara:strand:- start:632 stop:1285 length:654 start_codon:yes stop_codon:yes gene_type:complete